jgi:CRISP-associated protein Cas1
MILRLSTLLLFYFCTINIHPISFAHVEVIFFKKHLHYVIVSSILYRPHLIFFHHLFKPVSHMDYRPNTLTLHSFGARIRVKDGLFVVTVPDLSGANDHKEMAFAPTTVDAILLHPKTSVSTDVLLLAHQHQINLVIHDEQEAPTAFFAGLESPSSILIWKQQLLLHGTPQGLHYARQWLCLKTQRQIEWLTKMCSYRSGEALQRLTDCIRHLREVFVQLAQTSLSPFQEAAAQLRGIEGASQRRYLDTLSGLLPAQTRFEGRSRQPSHDIFNALLNYGYGILYRWVEAALWQAGLNPYIGFLHASEDRRHKALLFDFIESYRPWVDKVAFKLCARKEANTLAHTQPHGHGLWLNREGKHLMAERLTRKFQQKKIEINESQLQLRAAISHEARQFGILLWRSYAPSTTPHGAVALMTAPLTTPPSSPALLAH